MVKGKEICGGPNYELPGEVMMRDFLANEAQRHGITRIAVFNRLKRGGFYEVEYIRRVNARVVFLKVNNQRRSAGAPPRSGMKMQTCECGQRYPAARRHPMGCPQCRSYVSSVSDQIDRRIQKTRRREYQWSDLPEG